MWVRGDSLVNVCVSNQALLRQQLLCILQCTQLYTPAHTNRDTHTCTHILCRIEIWALILWYLKWFCSHFSGSTSVCHNLMTKQDHTTVSAITATITGTAVAESVKKRWTNTYMPTAATLTHTKAHICTQAAQMCSTFCWLYGYDNARQWQQHRQQQQNAM